MRGKATISILSQQAIDKLIYRLIRKTRKAQNGCINWIGGTDDYGYGRIGLPGMFGMAISTHRASFELFVGDIPADMLVLHECDNPSCLNPTHLFVGTQGDNMKDMATKGRATKYRSVYGRSKITQQIAYDVLMACRLGQSHAETARQFGLSRSHVSKIVRGERWKLNL